MSHPYASRLIAEILLLWKHFGAVRYDNNDFEAILVEQFDLPKGFNQPYCELLIIPGPMYPESSPEEFYLSRGLLRHGKTPGHYFDHMGDKEILRQGFCWYCLNLTRWRPNGQSIAAGDNLLTAVEAVYRALDSRWG